MYSAISKNGNTHFYFNGQLILKAVTWKYFCFDKFYIEDSKGSKLIEISILSMFGFWKKYSIKSQNLKNYVELFKFKGQLILDRKSTRLNSSHVKISYAVFCL